MVDMAVSIIGIDSSCATNYSCAVFGYEGDIALLHGRVSEAMFGRKNCILHWKKTSKKIRQKAKLKVSEAVNDSKVRFYVFEHKKPQGEKKKEYYLTYIPNNISSFLHTKLIGKYGVVIVEADRDFEVKGIQDTTSQFLRNFLFQMCFKVVGKPASVRREGGEWKATVKFPNQNRLEFVGRIGNYPSSKAIQLADIVLGYKLNEKGLEKVFYRKI
jgi:hypothetical protein